MKFLTNYVWRSPTIGIAYFATMSFAYFTAINWVSLRQSPQLDAPQVWSLFNLEECLPRPNLIGISTWLLHPGHATQKRSNLIGVPTPRSNFSIDPGSTGSQWATLVRLIDSFGADNEIAINTFDTTNQEAIYFGVEVGVKVRESDQLIEDD